MYFLNNYIICILMSMCLNFISKICVDSSIFLNGKEKILEIKMAS